MGVRIGDIWGDIATAGGAALGGAVGSLVPGLGTAVGVSVGASLGGGAGAAVSGGGSGGAKISGNPTDAECEAMAKVYDGILPSVAADIRAQCAARKKAAPKKKNSGGGGVLDFFSSIKEQVDKLNSFIAPPPPPPTASQLAAQSLGTKSILTNLDLGGKVVGKNSILLKSTNAMPAPTVDRAVQTTPDKTSSTPILIGLGVAAAGALYMWNKSQKKRGQKGLF